MLQGSSFTGCWDQDAASLPAMPNRDAGKMIRSTAEVTGEVTGFAAATNLASN